MVKDDGYDPARTIPIVDEYLDSDKVWAAWTTGTSCDGARVMGWLRSR